MFYNLKNMSAFFFLFKERLLFNARHWLRTGSFEQGADVGSALLGWMQ